MDNRPNPRTEQEQRSLGEVVKDLTQDFSVLFRKEVALAKTELQESATQAGKGAAMLTAGGFIAYAGFLALLAAAIVGLALVVPWWLSAVIVGVAVLLVSAILIMSGIKKLKATSLAPEETIESLKEDKEWAKEQLG
jgi:uncharacterized membrane protein YqjE